jgi:predicted DNA binding CopG/RHH family protein
MKLDAGEKELLESVTYSRYAKATFRKDRRLNIRLSSKDLEAIRSELLPRGCRTRR